MDRQAIVEKAVKRMCEEGLIVMDVQDEESLDDIPEAASYFKLLELAKDALDYIEEVVKASGSCVVERQCGYLDSVGIEGHSLAERLRKAVKEVSL